MTRLRITPGMQWFAMIFGAVLMLVGITLLLVPFSGESEVKFNEFSLSTPYPGLVVLVVGMLVFALGITGRLGFGGGKPPADDTRNGDGANGGRGGPLVVVQTNPDGTEVLDRVKHIEQMFADYLGKKPPPGSEP
ncbi:MAG: hypothetical protein V3U29_03345, partial [Phycisphaeraceae bacterium]